MTMRKTIVRVAQRLRVSADRGATAAEYAILAGFIVVVIAAGIGIFGRQLEAGYLALVAQVSKLL